MDWASLSALALENSSKHITPKNHDEWFELRELWSLLSDFARSVVLFHARIDPDLPLDQYRKEDIQAVKNAIVEMHKFTAEYGAKRKALRMAKMKPYANSQLRTNRNHQVQD